MNRLRMIANTRSTNTGSDIEPLLPEQIGDTAIVLHDLKHPDADIIPQFRTLEGCHQYLVAVMCNACGKYLPYASFAAMEPELSGFILTSETAPSEGHIVQIVVAPEVRQAGIGKRLVQAAINALYESGYKKVSLNVTESNIPAIKLYEKLGFRREG